MNLNMSMYTYPLKENFVHALICQCVDQQLKQVAVLTQR